MRCTWYRRTIVTLAVVVAVVGLLATPAAATAPPDTGDEPNDYYMFDFTDGIPSTDVPWSEVCDVGGYGDCPPPVTGEWWSYDG